MVFPECIYELCRARQNKYLRFTGCLEINVLFSSEIHAVMTGGFATVAGAAMAAYIRYWSSVFKLY